MARWLVVAAVFALIPLSQGCHHGRSSDDDEDEEVERITKRHTPIDMEEFLADCITRKTSRFSSNLYVPTVVDFMIRHSSWFEETDTIYCPSDDNRCWKRLVNYFLRWNSPYLEPAKACIDEFTIAGGKSVTPSYEMYQARFRAQSSGTGNVNIHEFKNLFRSFSPIPKSSDQTAFDLQSLVEYFRFEYICTPSFCDCTGLDLSPGERCGDNWLSRLAGATKSSSEFKSAVTKAANVAIERQLQRDRLRQRELQEQARQQQIRRRNSYQNFLKVYIAVVTGLGNLTFSYPEPPQNPTSPPPTPM